MMGPDAAPTPPEDSGEAGDGPGMVQINGTFTNVYCPSVNPLTIGPENGGEVPVAATVNTGPPDADAGPVSLSWTAPSGSFKDPHALTTTYRCAARGVVTVTFTVTATAGDCAQSASSIVLCSTPFTGAP
jgi:hypothetical protein